MIVTEEEAKTKRCQESFPACRIVSDQGHVFAAAAIGGGFAEYTAPVNCIGSACMGWRWLWRVHTIDGTRYHVEDATTGQPLGYCGKAGQL